MHAPGIWGIIIIAVVVIVLFGRGKISGLMGEVAQGIKSFQKGMRDDESAPQPPAQQIDATAKVDASAQTEKKDA